MTLCSESGRQATQDQPGENIFFSLFTGIPVNGGACF